MRARAVLADLLTPAGHRAAVSNWQSQPRDCLLDQRLRDKSPLRLAMDDNKNNHRAETEVGLRLMGQPSRR
jgi:hypothetical protein